MHSQQPPDVVQNWSTLQCSKQNTEQCGYAHAPVTRGRMRAQFPLPHGRVDHGSMSCLMFGRTKATRPPRKMRQRMRQKCVCCVVRSAPLSQFVMSVRSTIVLNALTPTLVGAMLFVMYNTNDSWSG